MSSLTTLARPYAKAAFELANTDGKLAEWYELLAATTTVTANDVMARYLQSPHSTSEKALEIIVEALGGDVDPRFQGYLGILVDNGRLPLCGEISRLYQQLQLEAEKRLKVRVISAISLDDNQVERIKAALAKRYDREILLDNEVDSTVLGGAVIYAGDQVIDGSLLGRLKRLEASLN